MTSEEGPKRGEKLRKTRGGVLGRGTPSPCTKTLRVSRHPGGGGGREPMTVDMAQEDAGRSWGEADGEQRFGFCFSFGWF